MDRSDKIAVTSFMVFGIACAVLQAAINYTDPWGYLILLCSVLYSTHVCIMAWIISNREDEGDDELMIAYMKALQDIDKEHH